MLEGTEGNGLSQEDLRLGVIKALVHTKACLPLAW